MPRLKIAAFNAEWMTNLFVGNEAKIFPGKSQKGGLGAKPKDCPGVCRRIAGVVEDLDCHIVGIVEGPPRKSQMELFAKAFLGNRYKVYSAESGPQSNHILVRDDSPVSVTQVPETDAIYKHLSKKLEYYHWDEVKKATLEKFTRKPAVLRFKIQGETYEIMLFHTKSQISKLKRKEQFTSRDKEAIVDALRSRQKLSAEMAAVRRYLSHAILSMRTDGCILMGDLNDGPHRDIFEESFLIHNIVDELRGGFEREVALMHHALPQDYLEPDAELAYSAEFPDPTRDGRIVRTLIDHIMVTTGIWERTTKLRLIRDAGKVDHQAYANHVVKKGKTRDDRPSDHRPVKAVLQFQAS